MAGWRAVLTQPVGQGPDLDAEEGGSLAAGDGFVVTVDDQHPGLVLGGAAARLLRATVAGSLGEPQHLVDAPTVIQPIGQGSTVDTDGAGPGADRLGEAGVGQEAGVRWH